ncbi:hypothetical protein FTX61_11480 [Nitriliruptoraceae bacterium ZYF776]|nr:hypothetical protein [Profundirhabdus halotolerans]
MPFTLTVLVLAIAVSYVRGGRLTRIADVQLRSNALLFVGLALQLAVDLAAGRGILGDATALGWSILLVSQLLVVGWLVRNRQLPGVLLVAVGLALNAVVIAANGAMPVDPAAMRVLGVEHLDVPLGKHTLMTAETALPWLADVIPLPPLRSIISVGDVVLALGLVPLTHALMRDPDTDERGRGRLRPARSR